jgi:hypothetical protein
MADKVVACVKYRKENNVNLRYAYELCSQIWNEYHGDKCVSCGVIEDMRKDLVEFRNLQEIACRKAVQDAVQVEINVLLIRLESLKNHEVEVNWFSVNKGGRRPVLVNCQKERPVLSNRYQPLYNLNSDEPTGRTQTERKALSRINS